jgi:hypothetical protein
VSAVKLLLESAVNSRLEENRVLHSQIKFALEKVRSQLAEMETNNEEIEEYLDALEVEADYLDRLEE